MDIYKLKEVLKERFHTNSEYHEGVEWAEVEKRLTDDNLRVLLKMELSKGEPDVVYYDTVSDKIVFFDTVKEVPEERGHITYDQASEDIRLKKGMPTKGNAVTRVKEMGTELLTETDYIFLQTLGDFDLKTSVWLYTYEEIRDLGGAIFGDKKYNRTFVYHNGAQSFYKTRGFRSKFSI